MVTLNSVMLYFFADHFGNCIPISWVSKKIKRVARSTLTAETLAAVEAVDSDMVCKCMLEDLLEIKIPPYSLVC